MGINQDQKGLQNPQENQTNAKETINRRQAIHRLSYLILTRKVTKR